MHHWYVMTCTRIPTTAWHPRHICATICCSRRCSDRWLCHAAHLTRASYPCCCTSSRLQNAIARIRGRSTQRSAATDASGVGRSQWSCRMSNHLVLCVCLQNVPRSPTSLEFSPKRKVATKEMDKQIDVRLSHCFWGSILLIPWNICWVFGLLDLPCFSWSVGRAVWSSRQRI